MDSSRRHLVIFLGAIACAGVVIATLVFPFWNLIREDVYEDTVILSNDGGTCYAETVDGIPKTITGCDVPAGTAVTLRYGEGLAWASIVEAR
ncbi:MAG: hypothetical protein OXU86_04640 [Thaumarchaeota archaeon]|nr:hypothetical protein [Nitrososphaerota archaeon]RNJ71419.1 MAG: hypothetical protein EB833_07155 [Thaumarchaeota archaeon S13]RNJ72082.1 MAG: hypothetical protein EB832_04615 [Thaumarchaeota archaeon S14]RNJ73858.1 MAG: hypothetical protein EB824_04380 [Thaumarchaeota archaeon S15]MDD9809168.1 hypothetical protein [Nitrososphaerota archaeon]